MIGGPATANSWQGAIVGPMPLLLCRQGDDDRGCRQQHFASRQAYILSGTCFVAESQKQSPCHEVQPPAAWRHAAVSPPCITFSATILESKIVHGLSISEPAMATTMAGRLAWQHIPPQRIVVTGTHPYLDSLRSPCVVTGCSCRWRGCPAARSHPEAAARFGDAPGLQRQCPWNVSGQRWR